MDGAAAHAVDVRVALDEPGLDGTEQRHLRALAGLPAQGPPLTDDVRPELLRLLDLHVTTPAYVIDRLANVLAANDLARSLHPSLQPGRNLLRDVFLDLDARARYAELPRVLRDSVAVLRTASVDDTAGVEELVEELIDSDEFAALWRSHDVIEKQAGTQRLQHPEVGELALDAETFEVSGTPGHRLIVPHAAPGGLTESRLRELSEGVRA